MVEYQNKKPDDKLLISIHKKTNGPNKQKERVGTIV